ncbi:MAG: AMP-binding protein [Actinomycetota bacterium]
MADDGGSRGIDRPMVDAGGLDPAATSIPALIRWSTATFADRDAIRDRGVTVTYRELGAQIDRAARALVASGIGPGDAVGVWAPNGRWWVVVGLAVSRAGGRLVPINTRFRGREAAFVLRAAEVRLLFVQDGFLDNDYSGAIAAEDLPALTEVVDLEGPGTDHSTSREAFLGRGDGAGPAGSVADLQAEVDRRSDAVAPDDIAVIMFTSGTTGNPKGVLVRGGAIIRAFHAYGRALTVRPGDPYLLVNPYFHAFGYNSGIIVCLLFGAVNLPVAVFDAGQVVATIERERVAVFPGPPALFQGLLNHPALDRHDLSSLRSCVTGAASIPVEMIVAMRERLGFEIVITAYGMTETSGIAAYTMPDDPPEVAATTSGRAIPGGELRIVDEAGREVPAGTEGELLVRGFQVTPGYLDDPAQTAAAIDPDGWLHTGDIAVMNADGYIDITDRKKDMFIVGGFNAYPAEIERIMTEHPAIGMVAVVGVADDRLGEVGAAFVVPTPGPLPEPADLLAWCREEMANYKVPRHLWLVDELPLTASNKVRKPDLRDRAAALLADAGAADSDGPESAV